MEIRPFLGMLAKTAGCAWGAGWRLFQQSSKIQLCLSCSEFRSMHYCTTQYDRIGLMPGEILMRCKYIKENGCQCQSKAQTGDIDGYCFFHSLDPETIKKRGQAQKLGGTRGRRKYSVLPPLTFHFYDPLKIPWELSALADRVYLGVISVERAIAIGRLSNWSLPALVAGAVAEDVAHVKQIADAEKVFAPDSNGANEFKQADEDASFRREVVELAKYLDQQEQEPESNDSVQPPQKNGNDPEAQ
jgi:hypothetical protein